MELRNSRNDEMIEFDIMDLLPAGIVCLGAAFVWMFWEMEQWPEHRHKTQLRWARLAAVAQEAARETDRTAVTKREGRAPE